MEVDGIPRSSHENIFAQKTFYYRDVTDWGRDGAEQFLSETEPIQVFSEEQEEKNEA